MIVVVRPSRHLLGALATGVDITIPLSRTSVHRGFYGFRVSAARIDDYRAVYSRFAATGTS
jgi:hypothetical protein